MAERHSGLLVVTGARTRKRAVRPVIMMQPKACSCLTRGRASAVWACVDGEGDAVRQDRIQQACACPCGASRFEVSGRPLVRLLCHCTICQAFNRQPYADVTAFWAGSITLRVGHQIEFKRYRPPPAARRGHCRSCSAPVVEFLRLAPFVQLAFVPSKLFPDQGALPPPALHIFYHRRLGDIADDLPKVRGYWASELAVMKRVLASIADA